MSINIESPRLANIWHMVEKLTPLEKLSLSELLTADVRKQLVANEQGSAYFVTYGETLSSEVDESDEWSEQDMRELREASIHYMVTGELTRDEVDDD